MNALHKPITDEILADVRVRMEAAREKAKEQLGERYLLHPANQVRRKPASHPFSQQHL